MNPILLHLLASFVYIALAAYFWRALRRRPDVRVAQGTHAAHVLIAIPLAMHALGLFASMLRPDGLYLGLGSAISIIIWLAVLIYWLGSFFYRLESLHVLLLPAAAALSLLPLALPAAKPLANTHLPVMKVHLLIALFAYSLFTIASLHVLLMALVERRLHSGNMPAFLQTLPPVLTMETLLFRIIGAGFVLLTFTLGTGIVFSEELLGKPLMFSHKTVFGILSWLIFAALLAGRALYGWRGRVAVRWTLAGFLSLVLAYIGSKFVLEVILHR